MKAFKRPFEGSVLYFILMTCPVSAGDVSVFSIANEIFSQNDCSDRGNIPCRELFITTCGWVGDSAVTISIGLRRNIPSDRIHSRILGDLVEVAEGSGGYVDVDLANAFVEPLWHYFASGQYDLDTADLGGRFGLELGMIMGGEIAGDLGLGSANEYLHGVQSAQHENLRSRWVKSCIETAYEW